MKSKRMGRKAINALDPAHLVYCCWVGSDDILVVDGNEVLKMAKETWADEDKPRTPETSTLFDAMLTNAKGTSGNSFDFVAWTPDGMVNIAVDWGKAGEDWMEVE